MTAPPMAAEAPDVAIVGDGLDSNDAIGCWLRTERDEGRLCFEASDAPPPGTRCWMCGSGQTIEPQIEDDGTSHTPHRHYCQAKGYLGEYAVCRECGTGHLCAAQVAIEKRLRGGPDFAEFERAMEMDPGHRINPRNVPQREAKPQPSAWASVRAALKVENLRTSRGKTLPGRVPRRRVAIGVQTAPARRCACGAKLHRTGVGKECGRCKQKTAPRRQIFQKLDGDIEAKSKGVTMNRKITDEIREQLMVDSKTMRASDLAAKYKVHISSLYPIVGSDTARGVSVVGRHREGLDGKQQSAHAAMPKEGARKVPAAAPEIPVRECASLRIPEDGLNRMWTSLTVAYKAQAIQALIDGGIL